MSKSRRGNPLRGYEATNFLFFLSCILALGVFVALVFQLYRLAGRGLIERVQEPTGILSEIISPAAGTCIFYLGSQVSDRNITYYSRREIPDSEPGLARGLFDIQGVVQVVVDQKLVIVKKSPAVRWEEVQPRAREIISNHLSSHP
ncbi:MAG: NifU N-terminal domain-containing protein [Acidobacteriota bacterium]